MSEPRTESTDTAEYAERLADLQGARWKRVVPNPYRWYLRHLRLGSVLEVGCGIGRVLDYLAPDAEGVDHNPAAVAHCRTLGLRAWTSDEFPSAGSPRYDALVAAHLLEHLDEPDGHRLLATYLPLVRPGGRVVLICPQERGQRSDPTHVRFCDRSALERLCGGLGLTVQRARSFPFPRVVGRWFVYNETVVIAVVPGVAGHAPGPAVP